MTVRLYYSRNYNPRLAVAVSRHLDAPVRYVFADPFAPQNAEQFLAMNPNRSIPILQDDDGSTLWEADAIACRLSQLTGSDFWRQGAAQPDMIRWLSWGYWNFVRATDLVHYERVTKRRYDHGPTNAGRVADGLAEFDRAARVLDAHLTGRDWVVGDSVSYADFRLACVLPYGNLAGLPLADHPAVAAWHDRLMTLSAWADPFAGLDTPDLPPIKTG